MIPFLALVPAVIPEKRTKTRNRAIRPVQTKGLAVQRPVFAAVPVIAGKNPYSVRNAFVPDKLHCGAARVECHYYGTNYSHRSVSVCRFAAL